MPDHLDNMVQQIMTAMTISPDNIGNLIAFAITMTLGFLVYIWAVKLTVKEKKSPYPIWMHCWYFTVDITGTIFFWYLAFQYDFFWMFVVFGFALPVWVALETWSLIMGIKYEREEQFHQYYSKTVSIQQAWVRVGGMIVLCFGLNNWVLYLMGGMDNAALFIFYPLTNFILSTGPASLWALRAAKGTREGNSIMLQILILCQVTVTWLPPGLGWWTSVSPLFDQPIYYIFGGICSIIGIINIVKITKLPAKQAINNKKPVW